MAQLIRCSKSSNFELTRFQSSSTNGFSSWGGLGGDVGGIPGDSDVCDGDGCVDTVAGVVTMLACCLSFSLTSVGASVESVGATVEVVLDLGGSTGGAVPDFFELDEPMMVPRRMV